MNPKNARPRAGYSPSLDKRPQGDPRARQSIGAGLSTDEVSPPLKIDSQGRATLDLTGPLVKRADGKLDLNFGSGLDVVTGSPKALVVRGSDSVVVNEQGVHSRPRASQVRDDSGVGAGTLADTLKNRVELVERKGVAGGYAPLDARNKIPSTYAGVSLGVAPLDSNIQVPGANLGGVSFAGVGANVLLDTSPPTFGPVPAAALPGHHASHETGGSDALTALSAAILTSGLLADARLPTLNAFAPGTVGASPGFWATFSFDLAGRINTVSDTIAQIAGPGQILSIATASFVGRKTAGTGQGETLSVADAKTLLSLTGTNSGDQTNISGNAATVTTNANLTGPITSVGNATSVASQTGTGTKFVMDTSPTLVTPILGTPTSGNATNMSRTGKIVAITKLTSGTGATFTLNALTTAMRVDVYGAGAGGGGAAQALAMAAAGGGGGNGGYAMKFYSSVTASYLYSIATGGAGGTAGANDGTAGSGATTFDNSGSTVSANQGSGGKGSAAGMAVAGVSGGAGGGVSTGGDINAGGAPGLPGLVFTALLAISGIGGSGAVGGGGSSRTSEAAGVAGSGNGSGGSGGCCLGTTARAGGAGKDGLIVVTEYQ